MIKIINGEAMITSNKKRAPNRSMDMVEEEEETSQGTVEEAGVLRTPIK